LFAQDKVSGMFVRATLAKAKCDDLLLEAMNLAGTHEFTRTAIYEGVALGGSNSFENDRKAGWQSFMSIEVAKEEIGQAMDDASNKVIIAKE
jgi:major membrane immunogen (membrane-anchored lipoprotein)